MATPTITEWQHKLAKDDKAVLVQFKNDTKDAWTLDFFDVENGKQIEGKKAKDVKLEAGESVVFAVKMASSKKDKKHTKVTHKWKLPNGSFLFSLFVWKVRHIER